MTAAALPWRSGVACDPVRFAALRSRTIFDCCKWDPQAGDVEVLLDTPLILRPHAVAELGGAAEALYRETCDAETALVARPDLHRELGLSWRIRRALRQAGVRPAAAPARVMRFDFHWTTEGWRISEVNSDVPGGYIEAAGFTGLMSSETGYAPAWSGPDEALARAAIDHAGAGATVGLVHATAYVDDRQVMEFLRRRLVARGLRPVLLSPADVRWRDGRAEAHDGTGWIALDLLFRFFPAEWLPALGWASAWDRYFHSSRTPLLNPATVLMTQSKRLPLVWDRLGIGLETWRRFLPETVDPRDRRVSGDGWVLKPALGRVGDGVEVAGATPEAERKKIRTAAKRWPGHWVAQRRFESVPWTTARGPLHLALGVFVIDGRAAGIYARAARVPLIDDRACDVAVLVEPGPPLS